MLRKVEKRNYVYISLTSVQKCSSHGKYLQKHPPPLQKTPTEKKYPCVSQYQTLFVSYGQIKNFKKVLTFCDGFSDSFIARERGSYLVSDFTESSDKYKISSKGETRGGRWLKLFYNPLVVLAFFISWKWLDTNQSQGCFSGGDFSWEGIFQGGGGFLRVGISRRYFPWMFFPGGGLLPSNHFDFSKRH